MYVPSCTQAAANHSLLQGIQEGYTGQLIAMPTGAAVVYLAANRVAPNTRTYV